MTKLFLILVFLLNSTLSIAANFITDSKTNRSHANQTEKPNQNNHAVLLWTLSADDFIQVSARKYECLFLRDCSNLPFAVAVDYFFKIPLEAGLKKLNQGFGFEDSFEENVDLAINKIQDDLKPELTVILNSHGCPGSITREIKCDLPHRDVIKTLLNRIEKLIARKPVQSIHLNLICDMCYAGSIIEIVEDELRSRQNLNNYLSFNVLAASAADSVAYGNSLINSISNAYEMLAATLSRKPELCQSCTLFQKIAMLSSTFKFDGVKTRPLAWSSKYQLSELSRHDFKKLFTDAKEDEQIFIIRSLNIEANYFGIAPFRVELTAAICDIARANNFLSDINTELKYICALLAGDLAKMMEIVPVNYATNRHLQLLTQEVIVNNQKMTRQAVEYILDLRRLFKSKVIGTSSILYLVSALTEELVTNERGLLRQLLTQAVHADQHEYNSKNPIQQQPLILPHILKSYASNKQDLQTVLTELDAALESLHSNRAYTYVYNSLSHYQGLNALTVHAYIDQLGTRGLVKDPGAFGYLRAAYQYLTSCVNILGN